MNYQFTAQVEEEFDHIADGNRIWHEMIDDFYVPFHEKVDQVTEHAERAS
jgi:DNA topoisomerase-1